MWKTRKNEKFRKRKWKENLASKTRKISMSDYFRDNEAEASIVVTAASDWLRQPAQDFYWSKSRTRTSLVRFSDKGKRPMRVANASNWDVASPEAGGSANSDLEVAKLKSNREYELWNEGHRKREEGVWEGKERTWQKVVRQYGEVIERRKWKICRICHFRVSVFPHCVNCEWRYK